MRILNASGYIMTSFCKWVKFGTVIANLANKKTVCTRVCLNMGDFLYFSYFIFLQSRHFRADCKVSRINFTDLRLAIIS